MLRPPSTTIDNISDAEGKNAMDLATERNDARITELLKRRVEKK